MIIFITLAHFYFNQPLACKQEERLGYREVILANTFQSLSVVLDAMQMMGIDFEHEKSPQEALIIADLGPYPEVSLMLLPFFLVIWQGRRQFWIADADLILDSCGYCSGPCHRMYRRLFSICMVTVVYGKRLVSHGISLWPKCNWQADLQTSTDRRSEYQLNDSAEVRNEISAHKESR